MQDYLNKQLLLGIRPEDIHNPQDLRGDFDGSEIRVMVEASKMYRGESIHYLVNGKNHFIARMDPSYKFPVGKSMTAMIDMKKIHLFDLAIDPENPPRMVCSNYGDE